MGGPRPKHPRSLLTEPACTTIRPKDSSAVYSKFNFSEPDGLGTSVYGFKHPRGLVNGPAVIGDNMYARRTGVNKPLVVLLEHVLRQPCGYQKEF